jgi:hypothetical protein
MGARDTLDNASFAAGHASPSPSHSGKLPFATSFVRKALDENLNLKCESKRGVSSYMVLAQLISRIPANPNLASSSGIGEDSYLQAFVWTNRKC